MQPISDRRTGRDSLLLSLVAAATVFAGVLSYAGTASANGIVITDFGADEQGSSIALQPDGKIIVAGTSGTDLALVRYHSDGRLDTDFGTDGQIIGGARGTFGLSIVSQSDRKILVGRPIDASGRIFLLTRYDPEGSVDTTFGVSGSVSINIAARGDHSIALQPDGKILVVGAVSPGTTFASHIAVVRLDPDGTPDNTFGTDGMVTTNSGHGGLARSIALQPDDKILAAGAAAISPTGDGDFALALYSPNGSPDASFSTDGVVTTGIKFHDEGYDVALQPDGKIIVVGKAQDLTVGDYFAIVRYTPNGNDDPTFGTGGIVASDLGAAHSVELQPDGKILVAGTIGADFALLRYNPAGTPDASFGTNGKVITAFENNRLALQPDGKILVAGSSFNGTDSDFALARYNSDGSSDTSFGGGIAPPATPTNLRVIPGNQMVDLRWSSESEGVAGWNVYFRPEGTTNWLRAPNLDDPGAPTVPVDDATEYRLSVLPNGDHPLANGLSYEVAVSTMNTVHIEGPRSELSGFVPNSREINPPTYPILLLHGIASDAGTWDDTGRALIKTFGWEFGGELAISYDSLSLDEPRAVRVGAFEAGHFYVGSFFDNNGNYGNGRGIGQQGLEVRAFLRELRTTTRQRQFSIVAHSMGGLAARSYMQGLHTPYTGDVGRLITYGTPHAGTPLATVIGEDPFAASVVARVIAGIDPSGDGTRDLRPDSQFILDLLDRDLPPADYVSIVGLVLPPEPRPCVLLRPAGFLGPSDCVVPTSSQDLSSTPVGPISVRSRARLLDASSWHLTQTSDYNSIVCAVYSGCLKIFGRSPIDIEVTGSDGSLILKQHNEIPGALYEEIDVDGNGDPSDVVTIPASAGVEYQIRVVPEADASPDETYDLDIWLDGASLVLASDERIADILAEPFIIGVPEIDILPGSDRNQIVLRRDGVVPVAILGGDTFDVSLVDPSSLTFGATGDERSMRHCGSLEDANDDGYLDLICQFSVADTGFAVGDTQGRLKGEAFDADPVLGADSILTR